MMTNQIILSFIVAIYNVEQFVEQCLDSLIVNTEIKYEIVLVDDGSTDASRDICDEYSRMNQIVRVIHKPNGGLVSARKAGVAAARGKYIQFVDGDDFISNTYFDRLTNYLEKDYDAILFDFKLYNRREEKEIHDYIEEGCYTKNKIVKEIIPIMLNNGVFYEFGIKPSVWGGLLKKELLAPIINITPNCISFGEDVAVKYNFLTYCNKILIIHDSLYFYRVNMESMTRKYSKKQCEDTNVLIGFLKKCFAENEVINQEVDVYSLYVLKCNIINASQGDYIARREEIEKLQKYIDKNSLKEKYTIYRKKGMFGFRDNILFWLSVNGILSIPILWFRLKSLH